ncbi:molybdopterin molybdotransferase MoeA [Ulvibacterium marinum]|uniref:molybdopterin molybdotransferase MoeA n=1 Tax=Ulvibacterium marinum TaxID=2419782 RepID=UPI00249441AD|nr:molybdopterin molybdotransferase MoeA [Ulvibacterium marinum]
MISFDEAFEKVMQHTQNWGVHTVDLLESTGRVLAEPVLADRDFPPFDRSTKDGIAIHFSAIEKGRSTFQVEGVLSAGMPQQSLSSADHCFEIMTGAVVPQNTDTVIMYEQIILENGNATIQSIPKNGQNVHKKGSDAITGKVLLQPDCRITGAEIGILATVGKSSVSVKKLPKVCVISTGNELVDVSEIPLPHQIRKSNTLSLYAALSKENIIPELLHLTDDKKVIQENIARVLQENDVILLSGGVSKGKFDFIPEVMESLGVEKVFHRVAQRPGKPFWFGTQKECNTVVFSFPGNPVSTFANYHIYFAPWFYGCMGLSYPKKEVVLDQPIRNDLPLTRFVQVKTYAEKGRLFASLIKDGGSGDLASLSKSDGFICLKPREHTYEKGELVPVYDT